MCSLQKRVLKNTLIMLILLMFAYYTIANVNSPFTAIFPSTVAIASPIPTGPFFFIIFTFLIR